MCSWLHSCPCACEIWVCALVCSTACCQHVARCRWPVLAVIWRVLIHQHYASLPLVSSVLLPDVWHSMWGLVIWSCEGRPCWRIVSCPSLVTCSETRLSIEEVGVLLLNSQSVQPSSSLKNDLLSRMLPSWLE